MKHYITPDRDGDNFTANKHYKIEFEYSNDRVLVMDDKGNKTIVRIDGVPSARLNYGGKFKRCSELLSNALSIAENAEKLVEEVKPEVEAQRRIEAVIGEEIRKAVIPGGVIHNAVGWRINDGERFIQSNGFIPRHVMVNLDSDAERLRKAEHDRDLYKQDCIKAEAVIDQLYELFPNVRNHEQLISAIKSAKIFSDAFLELQKIK